MYRTDFWTLWERARVGCFNRTASKHVYYLGWTRLPAQVGCMRQVLGPGALGRPRGIGWRGRGEGGSGWGIHVYPRPKKKKKLNKIKKKKKKKSLLQHNSSNVSILWPSAFIVVQLHEKNYSVLYFLWEISIQSLCPGLSSIVELKNALRIMT